jgi:hypothetical protein
MRGPRKTFKPADDVLIRQQPVTGMSLKGPFGIERENSVFR